MAICYGDCKESQCGYHSIGGFCIECLLCPASPLLLDPIEPESGTRFDLMNVKAKWEFHKVVNETLVRVEDLRIVKEIQIMLRAWIATISSCHRQSNMVVDELA